MATSTSSFCEQIVQEVPEEREPGKAFLTSEMPVLPFCDPSLATILALKQVSVIDAPKGSKGMQEQWKSSQETRVQS